MTTRFPVETQTDVNGNNDVAEQQIVGVHDNGSASGVIKTKVDTSELVKYRIDTRGYSSQNYGNATTIYLVNNYNNDDGTGTGLGFNIPMATSSTKDAAYASLLVRGRSVGIRFQLGSGFYPFTISIDGIAYPVSIKDSEVHTLNVPNGQLVVERDRYIFVVTDLPNIEHDVRIHVNATTVGVFLLNIYGILAEKQYGYEAPPHYDVLYSNVTNNVGVLTASAAIFPQNVVDSLNKSVQIIGIKSVMYYNSDIVPRTVTIQFGSTPTVIWTSTIVAGGHDTFTPAVAGSNGVLPSTSLRHLADAAGVVNYLVTGRI